MAATSQHRSSKLIPSTHCNEIIGISWQVVLHVNFREYPAMDTPLADQLRQSLTEQYGQIVGGADLASLLGFRSTDTFRKSINNNTLTLKTFTIPGRQGRFALTLEVATWLATLREGSEKNSQTNDVQ